MKLKCIVIMLGVFVLGDSLTQGLSCYKCAGDDDKSCSEFNVSENALVELCDRYPKRTPKCRISVFYEWKESGEKIATNVSRTGCSYLRRADPDECTSIKVGPLLGATTCLCSSDLCNTHLPSLTEMYPSAGNIARISGRIVTFTMVLVLYTNLQQLLP